MACGGWICVFAAHKSDRAHFLVEKFMKKKGFTLVELVVALAVSAILAAAIISLVVALTKYTRARQADRAEENELKKIEALFTCLSDYDEAGYSFTVIEREVTYSENKTTSEINVKNEDAAVVVSLVYTINTGAEEHVIRTLSFGETEIALEYVGDITFYGQDGILKCAVGDEAVYMLAVRAAKVAVGI